MKSLDNNIVRRAKEWLQSPFDEQTVTQVREIMDTNPKALEDAFFKDLEFGTGGMRGLMGVGTNRINRYTLGKSTQGLSSYLHQVYPDRPIQVVIAYDCRHNSHSLAEVVAEVFSANNIKVYLFSELRPTPELSFAVRYLDCQAGIVLTASHNPPEYNGYKVYWSDGGQIVPPHDMEIIKIITDTAFSDIRFDTNHNLIETINKEVDDAFIQASVDNGCYGIKNRSHFDLVFTPLHGTSAQILPAVLDKAGYKGVHPVVAQMLPDGDFPTVDSPNPEEPGALAMAIQQADEINADMVIGTDPDSDRLGVAVRDLQGNMKILTGNQTMILITQYLLEKYKQRGDLHGKEFVASTIVSTPMMSVLAKAYGVDCKLVLTGFKWIVKMIHDHPELKFIGGGEESFGYLAGDFVRDKDAVTSSLLACEMANEAKQGGSSIYEKLLQCYIEYGFYWEQLLSFTEKGVEGLKAIQQMMNGFRNFKESTIDGSLITWIEDYQKSTAHNLQTGERRLIDLPKADVLIFNTEDGSRIAVRPSGTEPKIKFYICVKNILDKVEDFDFVRQSSEDKIARISSEMKMDK